jgi:hypothetical protein
VLLLAWLLPLVALLVILLLTVAVLELLNLTVLLLVTFAVLLDVDPVKEFPTLTGSPAKLIVVSLVFPDVETLAPVAAVPLETEPLPVLLFAVLLPVLAVLLIVLFTVKVLLLLTVVLLVAVTLAVFCELKPVLELVALDVVTPLLETVVLLVLAVLFALTFEDAPPELTLPSPVLLLAVLFPEVLFIVTVLLIVAVLLLVTFWVLLTVVLAVLFEFAPVWSLVFVASTAKAGVTA